MKKLLLSLALLLPFMVTNANEASVTFKELGYDNAADVTEVSVADGDVTLTFDKGSSSSSPKYYNTGTALRLYGGNTMTVTGAEGVTITSVVITTPGNYAVHAESTVSAGELAIVDGTTTWTGSTNSFTFTEGGATGHARVQSIAFEYTAAGSPAVAVAKVTFSPAAGAVVGGTEVTLSCATEGAEIYYTTNGDDPTSASFKYVEPIGIHVDMTIKAIAVLDEATSDVSSAAYTVIPTCETVNDILALDTNSKFVCGPVLTVFEVLGGYVFVYDMMYDQFALIYKFDLGLQKGDQIAGGWVGSVGAYGGLKQLVPEAATLELTGEQGSSPWVAEVTAADAEYVLLAENVRKPYVLKGVTFSGYNGKKSTGKLGELDIDLYNQFGIDFSDVANGLYDVYGILNSYNGTIQLNPIEFRAPEFDLSFSTGSYATVESISEFYAFVEGYDVAKYEGCEEHITLNKGMEEVEGVTVSDEIVEVDGVKQLKITVAPAVTAYGGYNFKIPAGYLVVGDNYGFNTEAYAAFLIEEPIEPVALSVAPAAGKVAALTEIEILGDGLDEARAVGEDPLVITNAAGVEVYSISAFDLNEASFDYDAWEFKGFKLLPNITAAGEYTLSIPAGYFEFNNQAVSLAFEATWTIEGAAPVETISKFWNFSEWDRGAYEGTTVKDDLTVVGTVTVDESNKTVDGVKYSNRLKFGGKSAFDADNNPTSRVLSFDVPGDVQVDIAMCTAKSSDLTRVLTVYDSEHNVVGSVAADTDAPVVKTITYEGEATTLFIAVSGGINVYFIKVESINNEPYVPEVLTLVTPDGEFNAENVENVFKFEKVRFNGVADDDSFFGLKDEVGTTYGAQNKNTYAIIGVETPIVANGNSFDIVPGLYDVTVDWNNMTILVEQSVVESNMITVYWDNTYSPEWEDVFVVFMPDSGVAIPEGAEEMDTGYYALTMSKVSDTVFKAEIPDAVVMFGFGDYVNYGSAQAMDEEDIPFLPIDNHIYYYSDGYAVDFGEYFESAEPVTVYWDNSEVGFNPEYGIWFVYGMRPIDECTEDDMDSAYAERCNENAPSAPVEGKLYDSDVYAAQVPANAAWMMVMGATDDWAYIYLAQYDYETDELIFEKPVDGTVYNSYYYVEESYAGYGAALGQFEDVVTINDEPITLYWNNTDAKITDPRVVYSLVDFFECEETDFVDFDMTACAQAPEAANEIDGLVYDYNVYKVEVPANAKWVGFVGEEGEYIVADIDLETEEVWLYKPVAGTLYGPQDFDLGIGQEEGMYADIVVASPGKAVNVYWANDIANFENPTLVYSMVPFMAAQNLDEPYDAMTFAEMARCGNTQPTISAPLGFVYEYYAFKAEVPENAAWFGFCDLVEEDGEMVPYNFNMIMTMEGLGDDAVMTFPKPAADHVYGLEDDQADASDLGAFDVVVLETPYAIEEPGDNINIYWANDIANFEKPTLVYSMIPFELIQQASEDPYESMEFVDMTRCGKNQPTISAPLGFVYDYYVFKAEVPENAAWFGFCDLVEEDGEMVPYNFNMVMTGLGDFIEFPKPVAEHVYGLDDDQADAADFGAYDVVVLETPYAIEEPGDNINIYWANDIANFEKPTLVYSMIPYELIQQASEDPYESMEFVDMTRCGKVQPLTGCPLGFVYDYYVFKAEIPENAAWFGFCDMVEEDGEVVPYNFNMIMTGLGDFIEFPKPVAEHVYGLEDETADASDFGTYKDVVIVMEVGDPSEMVTVYWDNTNSAWDAPKLFYLTPGGVQSMVDMELCAEVPSQFTLPEGTKVYTAQVPAVVAIFGFTDGEMTYEVSDEDYTPIMPVDGHIYRLENEEAVDCTEDSGVESVLADPNEAVYYNLQGVRVENPKAGTYIVIRNGKVSKELRK